jgi:hypothetical protein
MGAIVVSVGRIKTGYAPGLLAALLRMGVSFEGRDEIGLRVRGAIAEILAGNANVLPRDQETLGALRRFLESIAERPNAAPVFKAMDKLAALFSADYAERLRQASLRWR